MSEIETELVKLLKFKKHPEDYEDRQEYLTALAEAVDGIKDDTVFDRMTEPAYDWLQDAVEARNKKQGIEDFPDAEPEIPLEEPEEETATTEGKGSNEPASEPAEVDEETPEETAEEEAGEEATEAAEESDGVGEVLPQPDTETANAQSGADKDGDPAPAKKKRKKHVQAGKYIKKKRGKPDIQPKHKPGKEPDYKAITGKKDRYGITLGTKTAEALKMFEKGCTMRDVVIDQGDTYYNVLRRLEKRGHRVEKLENKVLRLIHKDDLEKKAKGK